MLEKFSGLFKKSEAAPDPESIIPLVNQEAAVSDPVLLELETRIRRLQFEIEHEVRVQAGAQLELASIQRNYGAAPSEYEILAKKHYEDATNKIVRYNSLLDEAQTELININSNNTSTLSA